jgi:hypothetical protein
LKPLLDHEEPVQDSSLTHVPAWQGCRWVAARDTRERVAYPLASGLVATSHSQAESVVAARGGLESAVLQARKRVFSDTPPSGPWNNALNNREWWRLVDLLTN